jgi:hypothetical protein
MWHRVFSLSVREIPPSQLAQYFHDRGWPAEPHFRGDDLGWTGGELKFPNGVVILLDRYLTDEDDLRPELNAFAAGLEAANADPELMQHVIQTKQLITMPIDTIPDPLVEHVFGLCRWLAAQTDGRFQIDGRGWFAADGTLLHADDS